MACNGKIEPIPPSLIIPKTIYDYKDAKEYYEDKEYRLFLCLKFDRCY